MINGIGAAILNIGSAHENKIIISRSCHLKADGSPSEINGIRAKTAINGTIRHLGMVETNEITGKRIRDTIRVRSTDPIYAAVPQENAEEDIVHYDGALWRVIQVRKNASTWVATAVRTGGKKEFCNDDTNSSSTPNSGNTIQIIG